MANGNFIVQNGLQVGPLTIDAATGSISTTGTVTVTGIAVSAISQNDSSISINDTGSGSNVSIVIDGVTEHVLTQTLTTLNGNLKVNTTGYLAVPSGTNAQRPGSPSNGMMRYNSDITSFEGYYAGAWSSLGGVKSVDGKAYITAEASAGAGDDVIRVYAGDSGTSTQVVWASTSNISILPTTTSTSSTTGALQVAGGLGVVGAINSGLSVNAPNLYASTGLSTANAVITGGSITGITGAASTFTATNLSSGNAVITGGSLNSTPIGATTASTGKFTTIVSTSTTASTSDITGAVQIAGGIGVAKDSYYGGNLVVAGNLDIRGTTVSINSVNFAVQDSIIDLHTPANLAPLASDDGRDVGIKVHYYKGADSVGFFGWVNGTGYFEYYAAGTEVGNVFTSGTYGTIKGGALIAANTTASDSTTTGALVVAGGAGIAGKISAGSLVTANAIITGGSTGTFNYITGSTGISTSNALITGGSITGITGAASTFTATNLSSGNAVITGGSFAGHHSGNAALTYTTTTNFSSGNAVITGGTLSGITSAVITGGSITGITGAASTFTATNLSSGNLQVSGTITPNANATINIGSTTAWFNTIYGKSTQAQYADLAENYLSDRPYMPGQVVEFGGAAEVTLGTADSKRVAGVVSTNPAHLMNGGLHGANVVAIALQGRVPCNVIGPVAKGDLMVSAGFGFAKVNNDAQIGQVIGKSLEDFAAHAKTQIEIAVGRF